jgi:hypothetical protein
MGKPSIDVSITDAKGKAVLDGRYTLDTILPHTSIDYPVNVTKTALGVGTYTTHVSLSYAKPGGGDAVVEATRTLTPRNVTQVFTSASKATPPPRHRRNAVGRRAGQELRRRLSSSSPPSPSRRRPSQATSA